MAQCIQTLCWNRRSGRLTIWRIITDKPLQYHRQLDQEWIELTRTSKVILSQRNFVVWKFSEETNCFLIVLFRFRFEHSVLITPNYSDSYMFYVDINTFSNYWGIVLPDIYGVNVVIMRYADDHYARIDRANRWFNETQAKIYNIIEWVEFVYIKIFWSPFNCPKVNSLKILLFLVCLHYLLLFHASNKCFKWKNIKSRNELHWMS